LLGGGERGVGLALGADILVVDPPDGDIGPDAVGVQDSHLDEVHAGVGVGGNKLHGVDFFRGIALGGDGFPRVVAVIAIVPVEAGSVIPLTMPVIAVMPVVLIVGVVAVALVVAAVVVVIVPVAPVGV
jgi:hypothetical protein